MKLRHNRIITDALREIRNTFSRFLSLLVLSALAVCFLAGLRATAPDMKKSADLYFDQQNLMDLHVLSTLGLTDKDAEALAQQPGVAAVERAYTVDAVVHLTDNDYIVKVLSFTEDPGINAPRLVEGRLPQNARECLVEPLLLEETGLQLGDTLTLDTGDGDYADALRTEAFTIVGTADSPLYVGTDRGTSSLGTGKVSAIVLLPLSAFSMETYTDFYLLAEGTESLLCYDDAYTDRIDSLTDSLEAFADQRARLRGEEVIGEANEQLADAEQELADAQAEAEQELSDAWAELADARAELDDGWAEYHDGVRELQDQVAEAEQEIADGQTELDDALVELNDNEQKLTDARAELDDGWQEYYDGRRDYEDGLDEYEDGYAQYEDGLEQYEDGLAEYRAGQRRLSSALDQLNSGEAQYSAGKSQFDQFAQQLWTAAIQAGLAGGYPSVDALLSAAAGGNAEAGNVLAAVMAGIHEQLNTQIRELEATLSGLNGELEKATQAVAALPGQITALEEQNPRRRRPAPARRSLPP